MSLVPASMKKAAQAQDTDKLKKLEVMTCMECGCCAYTCPSAIPLVQYIRLGKQVLREEKK